MRTVEVVVDSEGKVTIRYSGFVGDACFVEAEKLYRRLRSLGVDVKVERIVRDEGAYVSTNQKTAILQNH